jgi:hypothetical protein
MSLLKLVNLYVSSIDLLKCVWHRLATHLMCLGGWKGVECLALPCRLKNYERHTQKLKHKNGE